MSTTTETRPFAAATNKLAYAQAFTRDARPGTPALREHRPLWRLVRRSGR